MSLLTMRTLLLLFLAIFVCGVTSDESASDADAENENAQSLRDLLRRPQLQGYGKRPSGHSFVRFGKRGDGSSKGHSFIYFGKRGGTVDDRNIAELFHYLQRAQEPSWKRGHSIMRFGKRGADKHNFIRFGKRSTPLEFNNNDLIPEELKRSGHSMMYFGKRDSEDEDIDKRGGHSMMYFGKRADDGSKKGGHSMMYFGKRDEPDDVDFGKRQLEEEDEDEYEKRGGHSMMYFGKRGLNDDGERKGHSMMYFGKRGSDDDGERKGHSMMYFGKRGPGDDGDRKGHSMMYFGKRGDDGERKGHSMMYFGKRDSSADSAEDDSEKESDEKRAKHDMMYFGKREGESDSEKRASHNMIHFGKREDESSENSETADDHELDKKASHGIIHFGKRDKNLDAPLWLYTNDPYQYMNSGYGPMRRPVLDKKKHNMMHFGKRSVENQINESSSDSPMRTTQPEGAKPIHPMATQSATPKSRKKRESGTFDMPVLSFSPFAPVYPGRYTVPSEALLDTSDDGPRLGDDYDTPSLRREIRSGSDTEKSKNVFLRFG